MSAKPESVTKPYLLLTPGPLTTTDTVKQAMLRDWCTWDDEYNGLVQSIRERLTGGWPRQALGVHIRLRAHAGQRGTFER